MSRKLKVYVSGPITKGNQFQNCSKAIRVGTQVLRMGAIPFVPHLSALWDLVDGDVASIAYDDWLEMDLAWIESCDVVLRLPGESKGAEMEVDYAESQGIPVFHSLDDLKDLIEMQNGKEDDDSESSQATLAIIQ